MATDDPPSAERFSLSRWSRRKHEVARAAQSPPAAAGVPAAGAVEPATANASATPSVAPPAPATLPPVESLTFDSDFAPFVQPKVDESTRRAALKKLFGDPRFNAMDGLDVYVDDYTQPDPMPAGMLDKLAHVYDAIVDADKPAAAAVQEGTPDPAAGGPAPERPPEAPAEPAAEPAQLAGERADVTAPLTPTLSPQAGRGSSDGRGS